MEDWNILEIVKNDFKIVITESELNTLCSINQDDNFDEDIFNTALKTAYDIMETNKIANDSNKNLLKMFVCDVVLYILSTRTGIDDIPAHRKKRYQEAINYLEVKKEESSNIILFSTPQQHFRI